MVTSPKTTPGGQQSCTENTELKINPANLEFYVRKKEEGAERGGRGTKAFPANETSDSVANRLAT